MLNKKLGVGILEGVQPSLELIIPASAQEIVKQFHVPRETSGLGDTEAMTSLERMFWFDQLDRFLSDYNLDMMPFGPCTSLMETILNSVEHSIGDVNVSAYELDNSLYVLVDNNTSRKLNLESYIGKQGNGGKERGNGLPLLVNNEGFEYNEQGTCCILRYDRRQKQVIKSSVKMNSISGSRDGINYELTSKDLYITGRDFRKILQYLEHFDLLNEDAKKFLEGKETSSQFQRKLSELEELKKQSGSQRVSEVDWGPCGIFNHNGAQFNTVYTSVRDGKYLIQFATDTLAIDFQQYQEVQGVRIGQGVKNLAERLGFL